jgi:hypothetical protein
MLARRVRATRTVTRAQQPVSSETGSWKAPTFVGIDISKHRLDVHLRPSGESFTIDYSEEQVAALVKAQPRLLLRRGRLLPEALREERVAEEEVRAAARTQGIGSLEEVDGGRARDRRQLLGAAAGRRGRGLDPGQRRRSQGLADVPERASALSQFHL